MTDCRSEAISVGKLSVVAVRFFGMDTDTALAEITFCEQQIAILQGRQIQAMAGFVAAAMSDPDYDRPEHAEACAFAEIALVLGIAPRTSTTGWARPGIWSSACPPRRPPCAPGTSPCPAPGSS